MVYLGSRDNKEVSASQAILNPFDSLKGLYIPSEIKPIDIISMKDYSYQEVAFEVLKIYFKELGEDNLKDAVYKAYSNENFEKKILDLKLFDNYGYLELFHGQSAAFKDMALALYPYLVELAAKKEGIEEDVYIISATSGDTGKAALEALKDLEGIKIAVLYPNNGVSQIQYEQMVKQQGNNVEVIAINGNFDDAQTYVKKLLNDKENLATFEKLGYHLMSANSINIARLLPQVIYYIYAYLQLINNKKIKENELIDIAVPTGNFGNILAAYIAKLMGVKVDKLVCCSNANNVLHDFLNTGVYNINNRELNKSVAPSMDILISSNLERLIAMKFGPQFNQEMMNNLTNEKVFKLNKQQLEELQKEFVCEYGNDEDVYKIIKEEYDNNNYVIDPHTALAYKGLNKTSNYSLVVATASPFKFSDTIMHALNLESSNFKDISKVMNEDIPNKLKELKELPIRFKTVLNVNDVAPYLLSKLDGEVHRSFRVRVPATTANIGSGFDVTGIALDLYNYFTFSFEDGFSIDSGNEKYDNKDNMVYQSYLRVMKKYNKEVDGPFNLKIETNIPIARGLGSSSTCILAGIVAANIYGQLNLSPQQIAYEACLVEGHPDNTAPAALGGMVSAVLDDNDIYYHRIEVAPSLSFYALIGLEELSTSKARAALPTELTYAQAIHNIARASICLNAFEKGIINYLPIVSQDQIHQEYRMNLICNINQIRNIIASNKFVTHWVSGAGTTMMFLAEANKETQINEYIKSFEGLDFRKLSVDYSGVMVEYY